MTATSKTSKAEGHPERVLQRWAFVYCGPGEIRLVGDVAIGGDSCVSSPLIFFDRALKAAISASGRTYLLAGDPGMGLQAGEVLHRCLGRHQVAATRDVTRQVSTYGLPAVLEVLGRLPAAPAQA